MLIKIGTETREVLPQDELAEELEVPHLYQHVPGERSSEEDENARNPKSPKNQVPLALPGREKNDDETGKSGRDRSFRECRDPNKKVKQCQPLSPLRLVPSGPCQHSQSEERGQRHVGLG